MQQDCAQLVWFQCLHERSLPTLPSVCMASSSQRGFSQQRANINHKANKQARYRSLAH